jgi:hypothetical protein
MTARRPIRPPQPSYERIGIAASLLVHAVLLWVMVSSKAPHPPPVTTIEVTIEPPTRPASERRPQIVSPSQQPATTPPENATRLSEKDSRTEVEKIQRGDGGGIPGPRTPQNQAPPSQQQPNKQRPQQKQSQQDQGKEASSPLEKTPSKVSKPSASPRDLHLKDLTLDSSTLAMKFGDKTEQAKQGRSSAQQNSSSQSLSDYQAFSRPPGSGAAFLGTAGISDHLPNLPDGDITLLNAKANIYASFVRRVAVQVFTQLRAQGWERLSAQQLRQLQGFSTIEAVLSPDGRFIRAQLIETSGSDAFDSVLRLAVQGGARDPNPPVGALAKDGLIHFIFKARSWSQMGVNRRSGAPTEHRWLLLATGLE